MQGGRLYTEHETIANEVQRESVAKCGQRHPSGEERECSA